jgi:hypothetical protein
MARDQPPVPVLFEVEVDSASSLFGSKAFIDQFGVKGCVLIRDVGVKVTPGIAPITRIKPALGHHLDRRYEIVERRMKR